MASNYPPGVTGMEFEINGADAERDRPDFECPRCGNVGGTELRYRRQTWVVCDGCDETTDTDDDD